MTATEVAIMAKGSCSVRHDTVPFNRIYRSRAITVALPLCQLMQNQDFLTFARVAVITNLDRNGIFAVQGPISLNQNGL